MRIATVTMDGDSTGVLDQKIDTMAIVLEKTGDKHRINLEKGGSINGEIIINLDWNQSGDNHMDLDLGCFYELRSGSKRLIDGLQFSHGRGGSRDQKTNQGSYDHHPYIWHTGDDRTGGSGETILVNPKGINVIKRMTIYTFIFAGATRWSETNAVVKVKVPGQEEVVVKMGTQSENKRFCAIAELEFGGDDSITVKKLVTFHDNHSNCDAMYNWGFNYKAGSKD